MDALNELIGENSFACKIRKNDGLYIQAMDSSHVALAVLQLKPETFKVNCLLY